MLNKHNNQMKISAQMFYRFLNISFKALKIPSPTKVRQYGNKNSNKLKHNKVYNILGFLGGRR